MDVSVLFDQLLLADLQETMARLDTRVFAEMRSYIEPPELVLKIIQALLNILRPEGEYDSWKQCKINQRIRAEHPYDHDQKSVLSKAHGQLLRLSATQLNVVQALSILEHDNQDIHWTYQISKEVLIKSVAFLEYFISQKFALGNPPQMATIIMIGTEFVEFWNCQIQQ